MQEICEKLKKQYYPIEANSWCKFNVDEASGSSSCKPGPGLPLDIVYKIRPIYQAFPKDSELEKCLHGKNQNANESFNVLIWEHVPKTDYVTLPTMEFRLYDAVGHFNTGIKSRILIYEKLQTREVQSNMYIADMLHKGHFSWNQTGKLRSNPYKKTLYVADTCR